jgi:3-isopropylmalate dehydrogenase
MTNPSILILPGDGIGPEVMGEVKKIIGWFGDKRGLAFDVSEDLVGGAAYDAHGVPLHDDTMAKAQEVDAVLLGAVGGPKYDNLDFSVKPNAACCACARKWTCSRTCAQLSVLTHWRISRR